jgi:hypothetical protein
MNYLKIESDQQYQEIASRIEALKNVEPGTSKATLLKFLIRAIVHHERGKREMECSNILAH